MYEDLLAEAQRLTGQAVIEETETEKCGNCHQHRHWVLMLPCGIMLWQRDENGELFPIHTVFCAESAATGWLAGFLAAWNTHEGGVDPGVLAQTQRLRTSPLAHVAGNYTSGRSGYNYGRWDRDGARRENFL